MDDGDIFGMSEHRIPSHVDGSSKTSVLYSPSKSHPPSTSLIAIAQRCNDERPERLEPVGQLYRSLLQIPGPGLPEVPNLLGLNVGSETRLDGLGTYKIRKALSSRDCERVSSEAV